jgi:CRP/FNR family transcriptional regulator
MTTHELASTDAAHPRTPALTLEPAAAHCRNCPARHVGFCGALNEINHRKLADIATWCSVLKGSTLIAEGEPSRHVFNFSSGDTKLYKDMPDGRRQIIGFVSTGSFVGFGTADRYSLTAESLGVVQFCRFDVRKLSKIFEQFPQLERRMLALTCDELAAAQTHLLLLGRKTAIKKLAIFLLDWSRLHANETVRPIITLPMNRVDIADFLGLTIETVARGLTILRKHRLIFIDAYRQIVILNHPALHRVGVGESDLSAIDRDQGDSRPMRLDDTNRAVAAIVQERPL